MARTRSFPAAHRSMFSALALVAATLALAAQGGDEPPPSLKAQDVLSPDVVRGPHYTVAEQVKTEGFYHQFDIQSDFGPFEAVGKSQLTVRVAEIAALASLQDVSKTEVFLSAAGQSLVNIGTGAVAAVKDPGATAKGIGAGVKRFGVNLGRRSQRAVEDATDKSEPEEGDAPKQNAAVSAGNSLLGVNSAMRRWAQKVGVDPYTNNAVLAKALEDIAKVDVAGSIATKVAVPVPMVVGMTSSVGDLVWGKDPEEVRKINETRLKELSVPDEVAKAFFRNSRLTLTYQTRFVAALHAVKPEGAADYVQTAAEAKVEREALFFVESAELLQRWHARTPVTRVLKDSRALVAASGNGQAAVLLPLDWVRASGTAEKTLREIDARAKQELGATSVAIVVTGTVTPRMQGVVKGLGWTSAEPPSAK